MKLLKPVLAALFLVMPVAGTATTVDFSENFGGSLSAGDVLTDFDFGEGLTGAVTTSDLGSYATGDAVIFDTIGPNAGTANDPDLAGPFENVADSSDEREFGNALILQERRESDPDDARNGGAITFTFDTLIHLTSLSILDGNDNSPTGGSLFLDGILFATNLGGGDNQFQTTVLDVFVTSFTVDFAGSGAIGEFTAAAVPLPSGILLLLGALGGLGVVRRRRKVA